MLEGQKFWYPLLPASGACADTFNRLNMCTDFVDLTFTKDIRDFTQVNDTWISDRPVSLNIWENPGGADCVPHPVHHQDPPRSRHDRTVRLVIICLQIFFVFAPVRDFKSWWMVFAWTKNATLLGQTVTLRKDVAITTATTAAQLVIPFAELSTRVW